MRSALEFDATLAMGDDLRQWLETHSPVEQPPPGTRLIVEGEIQPSLYLLLAGSARVLTTGEAEQGAGEQEVELATLGPGALVGEMSFLDARPPVASVVAGERCVVRVIDREALHAAIRDSPRLGHQLYVLLAEKLAHQLRSQNTLLLQWPEHDIGSLGRALMAFTELGEADIAWLAEQGRRLRLEDGEILIRQGEPVTDLFVILGGRARVEFREADRGQVVGYAQRGEILGEMTLLGASEQASADVRASGPLELLALEKAPLRVRLESDDSFAVRFYRALAVLLAQRSRHQLRRHGMALHAGPGEGNGPEQL